MCPESARDGGQHLLGRALVATDVTIGRGDVLVAREVGDAGQVGRVLREVREPRVAEVVRRDVLGDLGRQLRGARSVSKRVAVIVLAEDRPDVGAYAVERGARAIGERQFAAEAGLADTL